MPFQNQYSKISTWRGSLIAFCPNPASGDNWVAVSCYGGVLVEPKLWLGQIGLGARKPLPLRQTRGSFLQEKLKAVCFMSCFQITASATCYVSLRGGGINASRKASNGDEDVQNLIGLTDLKPSSGHSSCCLTLLSWIIDPRGVPIK